jgi:hypothetical protein
VLIDTSKLPILYSSWRSRYTDRDDRHDIIESVVSGDFTVLDEDEDEVKHHAPNLVQVALEDVSEAASLVPTIRVQPERPTQTLRAQAAAMERIGVSYLDGNKIDLLIPRTVMDYGAYGFGVWTVTPDMEQRIPLIERRNPRTCYPEPGYRPGDSVRRCMFARTIYASQLPDAYRDYLQEYISMDSTLGTYTDNVKIELVEYYDEQHIILAAMWPTGGGTILSDTKTNYIPVVLDTIEHDWGVCPVILEAPITLDGEFRGRYDQVIDMLYDHVKLMGLVIDYADQAVYSDVWVRDLIGKMPWGGGAYIELGPNGAIGRVPPAVNSMNVQQDIERIIDGIHLGSRWPKSRPGEIDQAIASAKFLESSVGMMNTAVRSYHLLLKRQIEHALRVAFIIDKKIFPGEHTVSGILRNQEFIETYNTSDINLNNKIRVEYGLGLGRDPSQSAVLHIQYGQNGYISKEFVQENIDGLTDVAREQARIDAQQFNDMALAKLLQGIQQGSIPDKALVDIAEARLKGESLMEVFKKFVVEPQEAAAAQMVPTGLGAPVPPGPPQQPGARPGQPPTTPPPAAPSGLDLMAQMGVPAGPGGQISVRQKG